MKKIIRKITRRHLYFFLTLVTLMISLIGCGSSSGGSSKTAVANTTNHSIYLPDEVDNQALTGNIDGIYLTAGDSGLNANKSSQLVGTKSNLVGIGANGVINKAAVSSLDVAGFIAERPVFNSETDAGAVLDTFENQIRSDSITFSLTSTGRETFLESNAAVSAYNLTLNSAVQPTTLANSLVQFIGVNTQTGTISNLPTSSTTEPLDTGYTLIMGVLYFSPSDIVVMVALVPSSLSGTYAHITSGISSPNNIGNAGATSTSLTDTFNAQGGGGLADFLFVIDNSGSMANQQAAISSAANAFETAITSSGLDFSIGTITTDSSVLTDSMGDGNFTNVIGEFKLDVVRGTSGSSSESGIWFAEQSLMSIGLGDSTDGSVTAEGNPRAGASLSVIMLSDEKDQYSSYSSGTIFDPTANLFLSRNYRVYSIINTALNNSSLYDDLSNTTGGSVADINDTTVFSIIMNNIATNAGGASSQFKLSKTPISATISITSNGSTVPNSSINGWTYSVSSQSILFHGSSVPSGGSTINVSYDYFTP